MSDPAEELATARRLARLAWPELPDDATVEIARDSRGDVHILAIVIAPVSVQHITCDVTVYRE